IPGPEAPPSPDYIPRPEAPSSPDYILRPEAPPSPDYISGPEYPEYLPPADDMLPAEEQPLPAAVSPTAESPGYITESEPEMEPEENDGDDEKSEGDSIDYSTSEADKCRADEKLIGRLRRERRYFRIVATTYAQEVAHSRNYCTRIMDYCQSREVHTSTLVTQMEALR
nr:hypothetical protein [Tanacetum cinerariifolium]